MISSCVWGIPRFLFFFFFFHFAWSFIHGLTNLGVFMILRREEEDRGFFFFFSLLNHIL
jgi:hypothetical protein